MLSKSRADRSAPHAGMPRRYYEYPERFQTLNVASTAGASLLAFGFIISAVYLTYALVYGRRAASNPWRSRGYEWLTESPPPTHNFLRTPVVTEGPYAFPPVDDEEGDVGRTHVHGAAVERHS